jgi:hypothetical protein
MATKLVDRNPHTGEALQSKHTSDAYRNNFDLIFAKCRTCGAHKETWSSCSINDCKNKEIDDNIFKQACNLCGDHKDDWVTCKIRNCPHKDKNDSVD